MLLLGVLLGTGASAVEPGLLLQPRWAGGGGRQPLLAVAPEVPPGWTGRAARGGLDLPSQRVPVEVVGGLLLGAAGALGGHGLGLLTCTERSRGFLMSPCESAALSGALVGGVALGIPLGVWLGGSFASGEGGLFPTFVGALVGGVGSLLLLPLAAVLGPAALLVIPALGLVGAVLSYEWSHGAHVAEGAQALVVPQPAAPLALRFRF